MGEELGRPQRVGEWEVNKDQAIVRWRTGKTNNKGQVIVVGRGITMTFTLPKSQSK